MITFSFSEVQFINIDAEGFDFLILQSFDFTKYRPKVIAIESVDGFKRTKYDQNHISKFLKKYGYNLKSITVLTNIYVYEY